jgi:lipoprotein-anchoring transpeptidase ErfK/SrfK
MRNRWLYRLANGPPLVQGLAVLTVLVLLAVLFIAGNALLGSGKPHRSPHTVTAATPSESPSASPTPSPETSTAVPIPPTSTVARATSAKPVVARTQPNAKAAVVASISPHNLIGQDTPFLVVGAQPGWYQALLPVRPNGTTGWISADQVKTEQVSDYLLASLSTYKLDHYVNSKLVDSFQMGIGVPTTPTPTGTYYVWAIQTDPGPPYDPVIFALSAFSPTLTNWPDGGIVGVHGWADASVVGKQVSNGCLRLRQADAKKLEDTLPIGTPIQIVS